VKMFRIENVDAKPKYDHEVQPPEGPKKETTIFFQAQVHKEVGKGNAHKGPMGKRSCLGHEPETFDHIIEQHQEKDKHENDSRLEGRLKPIRPEDVSSDRRPEDHAMTINPAISRDKKNRC